MTGGGVGSRCGVLEAEEALRVFVLVELVADDTDDTDDARVVGSEGRGCCAIYSDN